MPDRARPGKVEGAVFLQPLDDHEAERRVDRAAEAHAGLLEGGLARCQGREGMFRAEGLGVLEMGEDLLGLRLVGKLREEGPEGGDGLGLHLVFVLVEVVVDAFLFVPHEVVDAGLQGKVLALVFKADLFVVQDVPELRHVQGVDRLLGVEIHGIAGAFSRAVVHLRGREGDLVEAVLPLEGILQPGEVLLEDRHNFLDPLLVADLVVHVVLGPGEERRIHARGVLFRVIRLAGFDEVIASNRAVFFLTFVEVVQLRGGGEISVRIDQEEGGHDRFELIDRLILRIIEILLLKFVFRRAFLPVILDPGPGLIVYVDEILIVEMNRWKIFLSHVVHLNQLTRVP